MKKISVSVITLLLFVFSSCYDSSRDAKVQVSLGNIPIADNGQKKPLLDRIFSSIVKDAYAQTLPQQLGVIKVHLAAYAGESLIAKDEFDTAGMTSNVVEFTVPAGNNITILVVGENGSNQAGYYGYNHTPVDLAAGETADVSITVDSVTNVWIPYTTFTNNSSAATDILIWSGSGVHTRYIIEDASGNTVYSGYDLETTYSSGYEFNLYVDFEAFDLKTAPFYLNFG